MNGHAIAKILTLASFILFGSAGWSIYRYPTQILDFVFGKDPGQWRPIQFFRIFGMIMMCLAGVSAIIVLASAVLRVLV
jgi:hypothetical protein